MKTSDFDSIKNWLKKINLSLNPSDLESLMQIMKVKNYKKGDFLTKAGEIEKRIYFIKHGITRTFFMHKNEEYCIRFFFDHEFVSSYFSFITQKPSEDSIQAITDVSCFYMEYKDLEKLMSKNENIRLLKYKSVENFYYDKMQVQKQLLSLTAEERYADLIKNNPQVGKKIPLKYLSSYLGIKPQSLSRIRRTMRFDD